MRIAVVALLTLCGCAGTDLRLGYGHSIGGDNDIRLDTSKVDLSSSRDPGDTAWIEMGFQLTPQKIQVIERDRPLSKVRPLPPTITIDPPVREPIQLPFEIPKTWVARVEQLEAKVTGLSDGVRDLADRAKKEASSAIGVVEGAGGGVAAIVSMFLYQWFRRRREG